MLGNWGGCRCFRGGEGGWEAGGGWSWRWGISWMCGCRRRGEAYVCFSGILPFLLLWVARQRACCPLPLTMACIVKLLGPLKSILFPLLTCFCTSRLLSFSNKRLVLSWFVQLHVAHLVVALALLAPSSYAILGHTRSSAYPPDVPSRPPLPQIPATAVAIT